MKDFQLQLKLLEILDFVLTYCNIAIFGHMWEYSDILQYLPTYCNIAIFGHMWKYSDILQYANEII